MQKCVRVMLVAGIVAALLGALPASAEEGGAQKQVLSPVQPAQRPNLILILVDDLGYGDLSCYPHDHGVSTPNLDQLAASGVRMTQAYATPVCSPTRASLLTGRFPQHVGVYGNYDGAHPGVGPLRDSFPPLLQQAGYRCAWFGKWHQGWDVANHPLNNGFDVAYGFLGGMHDYYDAAKGDHYIGGPFAPHAYVFDAFKPVRKMNYLTDELTDRAISFCRETQQQPFFMYLAYNTPHTPYQAPDGLVLKHLKTGEEPVEAVYRAMIENLDASVGRLLAVLKETGLDRNTLVVFASDNGGVNEKYNGGLRGKKMTVWEGGIRVPLLATWPGVIPAGSVADSICCTPDVAATFMHLAGVDGKAAACDGVNLLPFWTGQRRGHAHDALVWSIHVRGSSGTQPTPDKLDLFAVRKGTWKVVRDREHKTDALYNLEQDPKEANDLSAQQPQQKAELVAYGAEFLKTCPPSCGLIANQDTRAQGDRLSMEELRRHCQELLKNEPASRPQRKP